MKPFVDLSDEAVFVVVRTDEVVAYSHAQSVLTILMRNGQRFVVDDEDCTQVGLLGVAMGVMDE